MKLRYNELRIDNELTQNEIAQVLKIKRSTYSKWELGINDMPLDKTNDLANFYHVRIDYLLGLSNIHYIVKNNLDINWNKLTERLVNLRKNNNYTQEYLSKKLGFHKRTYSNYETGTRRPTAFKLLSVAQFFKVSMDYLIGRVDDKNIK